MDSSFDTHNQEIEDLIFNYDGPVDYDYTGMDLDEQPATIDPADIFMNPAPEGMHQPQEYPQQAQVSTLAEPLRQQQQQLTLDPNDPPADAYNPNFDLWYNHAAPGTQGAHFGRGLGWFIPICKGDGTPATDFTNSGVSTPVNGQATFPYVPVAAPLMYPQVPLQAPQPYYAPTLAIPQPPQRPAAQRPAPTRRKAAPEQGKKVSIKKSCTCNEDAPKGKIPRPQNPFMLYRNHHVKRLGDENRQHKREGHPELCLTQPQMSKLLSESWNTEDKQPWIEKAERAKVKHMELYPNYKYKPGASKLPKFGDESCTCGAYQINLEHAEEKKKLAGHSAKRSRVSYRDDNEEEELPVFDPRASEAAPDMSYGPPAQSAQPQEPKGKKRQRSVDEQPQQPIRRSPRNNNNVSYQEPTEEDDFDNSVEHPVAYGSMTDFENQKQESAQRRADGLARAQALAAAQTTNSTGILPTGLALPKSRPAPIETTQQPLFDGPASNTRSRSHTPESASQTPESAAATTTEPQMPTEYAGFDNFDEPYIPDDLEAGLDFGFGDLEAELFGDEPPRRSSSKKSSKSSGGGSVISPSGRRRSVRIASQHKEESEK